MHSKTFGLPILIFFFACSADPVVTQEKSSRVKGSIKENLYANVASIPIPAGYERMTIANGSFGSWLRKLALKKDPTVYTYDGKPKPYQGAQFAVLNISVGERDLQQCADAVMRLRAEFLFEKKWFDSIRFYDNDKKEYMFKAPYSRERFDKYLQTVFGMCGTASLSKQLKQIPYSDMIPGDVFIRGGFPGHAVIVMDVAMNKNGEKIYLLAQSYMPAQDIHILVNPEDEGLSPWYKLNDHELIKTPEYSFTNKELKQW